MSSYITGSEADLAAFRSQLETITQDKKTILVGSFGRAAMYAAYGWQVPPLALVPRTQLFGKQHRDIDVMYLSSFVPNRITRTQPHEVDREMQEFWEPGKQPKLRTGNILIPVDPLVFKPVLRNLLGIPVQTFSVGTQLQFEHLAAKDDPKYRRSYAAFQKFAAMVKKKHPQEFLPDSSYEPFLEYQRLHKY